MKAAIYSPYLDTFGGGEKYMMTIAEILSQTGFSVNVILDKHLENIGPEFLQKELSKRFDLNLEGINFISGPMGRGSNSISRLKFFQDYEILFYLTDGSIFYPTAKRNILHIQSPLVGQPTKSLWGKLKLKGWDLIIYNSQFTKNNSEKNWPISSIIIYPPVDTDKIKPLKKKKHILSVGRFFGYLKDKKHRILIKAFRKLMKSSMAEDWSLNLVGSAGEGDNGYLEELKDLAKGLPVNFHPNLSYGDLLKLYGQSSIYWHASGFGEEDPTKMEHFGISTVEAMAAGAIPVVIGKGGQIEIVEDKKSGFLWNSLDSLEEYTLRLIENEILREKMSKEAVKRSQSFNKNNFEKKILHLTKIPE